MKKANPKTVDELQPEYKRSDFGPMVRGKYAARIAVAQAASPGIGRPHPSHQRPARPEVSGPEEPPAWRDQEGDGEPD